MTSLGGSCDCDFLKCGILNADKIEYLNTTGDLTFTKDNEKKWSFGMDNSNNLILQNQVADCSASLNINFDTGLVDILGGGGSGGAENLTDLNDVNTTGIQNNDLMIYDSSDNLFKFTKNIGDLHMDGLLSISNEIYLGYQDGGLETLGNIIMTPKLLVSDIYTHLTNNIKMKNNVDFDKDVSINGYLRVVGDASFAHIESQVIISPQLYSSDTSQKGFLFEENTITGLDTYGNVYPIIIEDLSVNGDASFQQISVSNSITAHNINSNNNIEAINNITAGNDLNGLNCILGGHNQSPKLSLVHKIDNNHTFDKNITLGIRNDMPNGSGGPTFPPADSLGINIQNNSDGLYLGIYEYSTGNYRPVLKWGDDADDSPFSIEKVNAQGTIVNHWDFSSDGLFKSKLIESETSVTCNFLTANFRIITPIIYSTNQNTIIGNDLSVNGVLKAGSIDISNGVLKAGSIDISAADIKKLTTGELVTDYITANTTSDIQFFTGGFNNSGIKFEDNIISGCVTSSTAVQPVIIKDDFQINGDLSLNGNLSGDLNITHDLNVTHDISCGGFLHVQMHLLVKGNITTNSSLLLTQGNIVTDSGFIKSSKTIINNITRYRMELDSAGRMGLNYNGVSNLSTSSIYTDNNIVLDGLYGTMSCKGDLRKYYGNDVRFSVNYAGAGYFTSSVTAYSFEPSSDDRLKHNEEVINNGLEILAQLSPQKYDKTTEFNSDIESASVEAGFIAQEVLQTDVSWAVVKPEDPETQPYSLNYNSLFTYAVAAIKELDAIRKTQAFTIDALENRIAALEENK